MVAFVTWLWLGCYSKEMWHSLRPVAMQNPEYAGKLMHNNILIFLFCLLQMLPPPVSPGKLQPALHMPVQSVLISNPIYSCTLLFSYRNQKRRCAELLVDFVE
jgi:hypothetical protein